MGEILLAGAMMWGARLFANGNAEEVRGAQSGRWTLDESPYLVTGNIIVPEA